MKKYLLLILMIPLLIGWTIDEMDSPTAIDGMTGFTTVDEMTISTVCTKDTGALVMDDSTMSTDASNYAVSKVDAVGQSISYGNEWLLYSIVIDFGSSTSSCVATVRIGASDNLGTYMEEWASVNVGEAGEYEFVSVDNDTYNSSTEYYIGILEISGICTIKQDSTSPPYTGGAWWTVGTGWDLDIEGTSRDNHYRVYQCE